MRAALVLALASAAALAALSGCGTGCPTPAGCADVLCGCIQPLPLRGDPNAAALAREAGPALGSGAAGPVLGSRAAGPASTRVVEEQAF